MREPEDVTIGLENEDKGKVFRLTPMPAMQAAKWAMKAFSALGRSGVELPEGIAGMGMQGIAIYGLRAIGTTPWPDFEPLLDELWTCVQFVAEKGVRRPIDTDFDDPATIFFIYDEVIRIHTGFSIAAALSSLGAAAQAEAEKPSSLPNTRTSRKSSRS
jgi:hypothetical protein